MYHLTLTVEQQNAIDWVGHRYFGGNDLKKILLSCDLHEDCDGTPWGENDLTFLIPEHKAWEIQEGYENEGEAWPCFSPEFVAVLDELLMAIV